MNSLLVSYDREKNTVTQSVELLEPPLNLSMPVVGVKVFLIKPVNEATMFSVSQFRMQKVCLVCDTKVCCAKQGKCMLVSRGIGTHAYGDTWFIG